MLSAAELNQIDEILADRLGQPRPIPKSGEEACSSCSLTMEDSKLIASRNNGEVVIVPMDLFRDMLDEIEDSLLWEHAVKLLVLM
jgi:hypothetical protein